MSRRRSNRHYVVVALRVLGAYCVAQASLGSIPCCQKYDDIGCAPKNSAGAPFFSIRANLIADFESCARRVLNEEQQRRLAGLVKRDDFNTLTDLDLVLLGRLGEAFAANGTFPLNAARGGAAYRAEHSAETAQLRRAA